MRMFTVRQYELGEVVSALQKAIRRGDERMAGYWAIEMFESNFKEYLWRRLMVISAEDCAGVITQEIEALYRAWQAADKHKKGKGRIFCSKAVVVMCQAKKSRDADHLTNLLYDRKAIDDEALEADLEAARAERVDIPEYAHDCHTLQGKRKGKTKTDFFVEEHEALRPRQVGLFDYLAKNLKTKENL